MVYSIRTDVENVYGKTNVEKWADPDNTGDVDDIQAQIEYAISRADNAINEELGGVFSVPFSPVPDSIKFLSADYAGYFLQFTRRAIMEDSERANMDKIKSEFMQTIRDIRTGRKNIGVLRRLNNAPFGED